MGVQWRLAAVLICIFLLKLDSPHKFIAYWDSLLVRLQLKSVAHLSPGVVYNFLIDLLEFPLHFFILGFFFLLYVLQIDLFTL